MSRAVPLVVGLFLGPVAAAGDRPYADALKAAGHSVRADKNGRLVGITFHKSETLADADYDRLAAHPGLKQVTFYGTCTMTDAQAARVGRLAAVEELAVNGTALSDDGFKHLGKLANLRRLTFWHLGWQKVPLTGAGFAELANCPKLEEFGFGGSAVGDDGLKALAGVKQLKHLACGHTRVTDAGLRHLAALPDLRSVAVGPQFSMRLGDAGLATLATIPTLERITYDETTLTYAGSLRHLAGLKNLKELKLGKTDVPPADLDRLRAELPALRVEHTPPDAKSLDQMRRAQEKR